VGPFFRWMSDGAYRPQFVAGQTVAEGSGCTTAVADQVTSQPNGVIIVEDTASNGGSAQSGVWCPYEGQCPPSPLTYPENYRSVTLGAHAVVGSNPRLVTVVHELGHTLHFAHTFSGQTAGTWAEYDNPIDVMSRAGDRTRLMGTLALNRYIAGWIEPEDVLVADGAGSFLISPLGGTGDQLLLIENGEQGWLTVVDARVRSGYDEALPEAGVSVHVLDQRAEACGSSLPCFGLSRRVSQWPAEADSTGHLLAEGDELVLPNGWILAVTGRTADGFQVSVADTGAPRFTGPVYATGVETSSVAIAWEPAQDEETVTYHVAADSRTPIATTDTQAVLTGLTPDREYEIRVTARDASGNEVSADPIGARTLSARDKWASHEAATGRWSFRQGEGVVDSVYFGVPGDVPLLCDWNGDGQDTIGLFRPHEGFVYLRNANSVGLADVDFFYGTPSDTPLCGDWDGDGADSIGVYRPHEQRFYLRNANSLGFADFDFQFGVAGDRPVVGDWDGDGIDTVGVYRSTTGLVHGLEGEVIPVLGPGHPVVADYSGAGRDGVAAFSDGVLAFGTEGGRQLIRFATSGHSVLSGWWE
ncbi:MAG: fibronectin type III domain-containing protein, partial [Acidimicrobiia bacterium]